MPRARVAASSDKSAPVRRVCSSGWASLELSSRPRWMGTFRTSVNWASAEFRRCSTRLQQCFCRRATLRHVVSAQFLSSSWRPYKLCGRLHSAAAREAV